MQDDICGVHAPKPHCETICHATGEEREGILKKLKCLLNTADNRKCVLPDIPCDNGIKVRPPVSDFPNPKRPLITFTGTAQTRITSEPHKNVDDPPDRFYKAAPNLQRKRLPLNTPGRKKSVELIGGVFYGSCFCVKRNGLQADCPRTDCLGRPECLAMSPGPCCGPALTILGIAPQNNKGMPNNCRRQSEPRKEKLCCKCWKQ